MDRLWQAKPQLLAQGEHVHLVKPLFWGAGRAQLVEGGHTSHWTCWEYGQSFSSLT